MNDALTPEELVEALWVNYFTVIRAFLLAVTATIHAIVLVVATFTAHLLAGAAWMAYRAEAWHPVKPAAFGNRDLGRGDAR